MPTIFTQNFASMFNVTEYSSIHLKDMLSLAYWYIRIMYSEKYVVKHKSAKLLMTYAHDVCCRKVRGSSQYKPFDIKYKQSEC